MSQAVGIAFFMIVGFILYALMDGLFGWMKYNPRDTWTLRSFKILTLAGLIYGAWLVYSYLFM